jgi:iron(III) transport system permease protein
MALLTAESAARGSARYARVGPGVQRRSAEIPLGRNAFPAQAGVIVLALLAVAVPVWTLVRWLWIGGRAVWAPAEIAAALTQTIGLAGCAAVVATVLAYPIGWVAVRSSGPLARIVEGANWITSSLPGIVTALALVTIAIDVARPLYQSVGLVIAAYVLMFLPRAMVNVRSGLAQVPIGLEEASRALGVSAGGTFVRVTLPLTAPAAASGAALVFVAVATELTATLLLAPTGTNTLAMRFWSYSSELDYAAAAPYALIMVILAVPVTLVLLRQATRLVRI